MVLVFLCDVAWHTVSHTAAMLNVELYVLCTCDMECQQGVKIIRQGCAELANVPAQSAGVRDGGLGAGGGRAREELSSVPTGSQEQFFWLSEM